jgi:hypothetical protein
MKVFLSILVGEWGWNGNKETFTQPPKEHMPSNPSTCYTWKMNEARAFRKNEITMQMGE